MVGNLVRGAVALAVGLAILYLLTWAIKKAPAPISTFGATVEKFTQPH